MKLTPTEWLDKIPCKIYNPDENKSYLIVAVSKEGIWYQDSIGMYDEDSFFGDGYYEVDCPRLMKYKDIPTNAVLGDEPTRKQTNWLAQRGLMTESMTKQEAWIIIGDAVKKARERNNYARQLYDQWCFKQRFDSMFDDDDIMGQCGSYIDDEDEDDPLW